MKSCYLKFWKMKTVASILPISFFLLVHFSLTAQFVSLKGHKISLPENNYSVVEVIDARNDVEQQNDKSVIGLAYDYDLHRKKKPVKMDDKLETSLLSLFQSNDTQNPEKLPLIIKINKFLISDFGGKNDLHCVIEVNLDFYTVENGMYYHEFIAGRYLNSSAHYPIQIIDMMIINSLELCYNEFLHRMDNHWGYHIETAKNELQNNSLNHETFTNEKIYFKKDAIYHSFNDFRDNFADTLTKFKLKLIGGEYGSGISKLKSQITDKGSINVNEIWGAQYNGKLYIQVAGHFIPVVSTPDGYVINSMTTFNKHNYTRSGFKTGYYVVFFPTAVLGLIALGPIGIFFPSALLGLAGGGIGAGIGALSPKIKLMNSEYKIDEATGMPVPKNSPESKNKNVNKIIDTLNTNVVVKEEKPLKTSDENPNESTKRGNNVFIELPDVTSRAGEKYFVEALEEWGYWNIVKNKHDADFIIVFDIDEKMMGDRSACVTLKTIDNKQIKKSRYYRSSMNIFNGYNTEKGVANKIVEMYLMMEFKSSY